MKKFFLILSVCASLCLAYGCSSSTEGTTSNSTENVMDDDTKAAMKAMGSANEDSDSEIEDDLDVDDEELSTSTSSKTNWDEILNEYEEYVNSYIRLYKKAMNGDMSAMTEYVKFMEKAEKLYDKMDNADDMTMAQMNRMNKIHMKMANAMQ